ncbi:MAG: hypothetical protein FJY88_09660 [Candidatus Eisenbacteria bacterium]|nr:hypothetical protein [Candidatus Eisenbacteria bacterium]
MNEERATEHPDEDLLAAWILEGEEPEGIRGIRLHVEECRACAARIASLRRLSGALEAAARIEGTEVTDASRSGVAQPWRLRWRALDRARRRSDLAWAMASLAAVALVALSVPRSGGPSGSVARDGALSGSATRDGALGGSAARGEALTGEELTGVAARNEASVEEARTRLADAIARVPAARLDSLISLPAVAVAVRPIGEPSSALEAAYEMGEAERETLRELLRQRLGGAGGARGLDYEAM